MKVIRNKKLISRDNSFHAAWQHTGSTSQLLPTKRTEEMIICKMTQIFEHIECKAQD